VTNLLHRLDRWVHGLPPEEVEDVQAAHRNLRDAIHENRNVMMVSDYAARESRRTSDRATRVAENAITTIEKSRRDPQ
jgi:hypothetical protein